VPIARLLTYSITTAVPKRLAVFFQGVNEFREKERQGDEDTIVEAILSFWKILLFLKGIPA